MTYTLEYAKSARSTCRGSKKNCPAKDRTISQGELRLGVEVKTFNGIMWRHWTCTTSTVLSNMQTDFTDPSEIPGWDSLRDDDKERVQRAWDEGKIPDNELPEPAKEHEDPRAKRKGSVDLSPTNEIAAEREKKGSKKKSKANDEANEKDQKEDATGKKRKATNGKNGKANIKEEDVKEENGITEAAADDSNDKKDDAKKAEDEKIAAATPGETFVKRPRKQVPEEPKVASYASRKKTSQKTTAKPSRRSARVAAAKKEDRPAPVVVPKRKSSTAAAGKKKAKIE